MNIFLIPGNPPASHFYQQWLAELEETGVFTSSHFHIYPTFKEEKNQQSYWQGVVDFYHEKLSRLDDVVLIGHSVGGKVALDLMQRNPQNVKKCFLLFPFLINPSMRGKVVLEGVSRLHQFAGTRAFIKSKKALNLFSKELSKLSDEEVESCLHLLTCERETIGKIPKLEAKADSRVEVFYTLKDTWCHQKTQSEFKKIFSSQEVAASHDFVIYQEERDKLRAELIRVLLSHEEYL